MSRFFAAIGRFAVRFRWVVVAAWIAAAIGAQHFFPSLDSVAGASDASFLPASSASMQAARLAAPFQGVGQTSVPVVIAGGGQLGAGPLSAGDLGAVDRLAAGLGRVAGVRQVRDLGVSRDGRAVQLQVLAAVNLDAPGPAQQLVTGLRHAIAASALPGGLHAHLAGPLASQADASQSSGRAGNLPGRGGAGEADLYAPYRQFLGHVHHARDAPDGPASAELPNGYLIRGGGAV